MFSISKNIIFTTEILPFPIPEPQKWWYYGLEHGQHISFYSKKTFQFIARKYDLKYYNLKNLHILSPKKISNFSLNILKFSKYGLYKLLLRKIVSKTWEDHLRLKNE